MNREDIKNETLGWGKMKEQEIEFWDARPIFGGERVEWKDRFKLLFYPKKLLLYRWIERLKDYKIKRLRKDKVLTKFRILDVGCGTGASVIEMKKLWGREVEIIGVDVIHLQVDLAKERVKEYGVWAEFLTYDGNRLPFENESFDAVFTSDVLGHVHDVPAWLDELNRVLKPGGALAMFAESKLGKHAYIRNYLLKRGLNTDPHAQFHISLYSKKELRYFLEQNGFEIKKMYTTFWAKFFFHPDELYVALQGQNKFFVLRVLNKLLYWIKKKTHPFSTAFAELYGLVEMLTVGRWVESQGYVVLGVKTSNAEKN
ncbi:MAG: class I SAM-dependent methyltransferase [Candidatus Magasanikbacteria bacterium]